MNILFLGPYNARLINYLFRIGDTVRTHERFVDNKMLDEFGDIDYVISYNYRYILNKCFIDLFKDRAINLHISLLPWNRGADPNLWSFLEDTPKGVTIHYIDYGLDTGDIIAQQDVLCQEGDTLSTSYHRLIMAIEQLFIRVWPSIRTGSNQRIPQVGDGSYHRLNERCRFEHLLDRGWDTPVANVLGRALKNGDE